MKKVIICSLSLIFFVNFFLPGNCNADYDHVLYYKHIGKYRLLIAFPKDAPENSRSVLFSDNDWHMPRYRTSREIREFFSALGFPDRRSRIAFRKVFDSNIRFEWFNPKNWEAFFNWLSDMKVVQVAGKKIFMREFCPVDTNYISRAYRGRNYFPAFFDLEKYLPELELAVSNVPTDLINFGEVFTTRPKRIDAILTANNINNVVMNIVPANSELIDEALNIGKLNEPLFLNNAVPETVTMIFSPPDSVFESKFWQGDTLTYHLSLSGEYLPANMDVTITGIRKKGTLPVSDNPGIIDLKLSTLSKAILLLLSFVVVFIIVFLILRKHNRKKEVTAKRTNKNLPAVHQPKKKAPEKRTNRLGNYFSDIAIKLELSGEDIDLIGNIKRLYISECTDIKEYIRALQIYFKPEKYNNKMVFDNYFKENQRNLMKDRIIREMRMYKDFFKLLKEECGCTEMNDSEAKEIIIDKIHSGNYFNGDGTGENYSESPDLNDYDKYSLIDDLIKENITYTKKGNEEHLLVKKRQVEELLLINEEQKQFIEGISQGYINVKMNTDNLPETQIDYNYYISIQKLCQSSIDHLHAFLVTVIDLLNSVDRASIDDYWLKIIDNVLMGRSGIAGIKGCLDQLTSFKNPLFIIKFFEIHNDEELGSLAEDHIKVQFREKLLLSPFYLPYLWELRRLYLSLQSKENKTADDEKLHLTITSINKELYDLFKFFKGPIPHLQLEK